MYFYICYILNVENEIKFKKGSVWIVGAGPGDPGLLTIHAVNAIRNADIIFYDALINNQILNFSKENTKLIYVGKRAKIHSISQLEISNKLVFEAKKNKRVLRLKGGDPFVFGRGGEEALALTLNKIPFRIVPGITAGIGGLAYAGIPATHRDFNTSVTFISAYGAGGEKPETIEWKSFAKTSQLIVIYMGLERIHWVSKELILKGRNKKENIAIISNATRKNQKVIISNLENCSDDLRKETIQSPALFVIGKNVLLSPILNWFKTNEIDYFYKEELLKKKYAKNKSI